MGKVFMSGCAKNATVPHPKVISTFQVTNVGSFNFVVGMTWSDFVSSEYNTGEKFSIKYLDYNDKYAVSFYDYMENYVLNDDGSYVNSTDLIIENHIYERTK